MKSKTLSKQNAVRRELAPELICCGVPGAAAGMNCICALEDADAGMPQADCVICLLR